MEEGNIKFNSQGWVTRLGPQVIPLSVFPSYRRSPSFLEALQALEGYALLNTDRHGWIELTTDGEKMWVEVGRR